MNLRPATTILILLAVVLFRTGPVQAIDLPENYTFGFHSNGTAGTWCLGATYRWEEDWFFNLNLLTGGMEGKTTAYGLESTARLPLAESWYDISFFHLPPVVAAGIGTEPVQGLGISGEVTFDDELEFLITEVFLTAPEEWGGFSLKEVDFTLQKESPAVLPGKNISLKAFRRVKEDEGVLEGKAGIIFRQSLRGKDFCRGYTFSVTAWNEEYPEVPADNYAVVALETELAGRIAPSSLAALTLGVSGGEKRTGERTVLVVGPEVLWHKGKTSIAAGAKWQGKESYLGMEYRRQLSWVNGELQARFTRKAPGDGPLQWPLSLSLKFPWSPGLVFRVEIERDYTEKIGDPFYYQIRLFVSKEGWELRAPALFDPVKEEEYWQPKLPDLFGVSG